MKENHTTGYGHKNYVVNAYNSTAGYYIFRHGKAVYGPCPKDVAFDEADRLNIKENLPRKSNKPRGACHQCNRDKLLTLHGRCADCNQEVHGGAEGPDRDRRARDATRRGIGLMSDRENT